MSTRSIGTGGRPNQRAIHNAAPGELDPGDFPAGSMRPKIEAASAFVGTTGGIAGSGALQDALAILERRAGTEFSGRDSE